MKRYLLIFALLLGAVCTWGRDPGNSFPLGNTNTDVNTFSDQPLLKWTLLQTMGNVKVYRAYAVCANELRVFLKVENNNGYSVKAIWQSQFLQSGNILLIDKPFVETVAANSTNAANCGDDLEFNPYVYVTNIQEGISDYQIHDLNIEIL